MFPIKWSDFFRKKDGNLVFMDEMGGGSVNYMSQSEWDSLTIPERKNAGFTAIGPEGSIAGKYYDFSNLDHPWYYDASIDNVVAMFDGELFNFYGFFSRTIGDVVTAGDRGGTRATNDVAFICNGRVTNGYGFFMMFGSSAEALACTNTSFFDILKVKDRDLYVASNRNGAWHGNTDVTLTHNGETQRLIDYFTYDQFTMLNLDVANNEFVIPSVYSDILDSIEDFLVNA